MRSVRKFINLLELTVAFDFSKRHAKYIFDHKRLHALVALVGGVAILVFQIGIGCGKSSQGNSDSSSSTSTGWTFVDGNGTTGINRDPSHQAGAPQLVSFNSKLYAIWPEDRGNNILSSPTRVAVYNGNDNSPLWTFVDANPNGLSWDSTKEAGENIPRAIVFNSKLYALWGERDINNAIQLRVAVYNGNDISPGWSFVDGNTGAGLNRNSNRHVWEPQFGVFSNKLHAIWSEDNGTSAHQIRVSVYNGNDSAPSWTFVDGNNASTGINKDTSKNTDSPQLIAFGSKLYAVWDEMDSKSQVRVAVYNGNDGSPSWTFVDGNGATGINKDSSRDAGGPWPNVFNNKLYIATGESNGLVYQTRVAVFNGNDGSPTWSYVDGNASNGLNRNPAQGMGTPPQIITFDSQLYLAWIESLGSSSDQVRVASYNGADSMPIWTFVDGGGSTGINKNVNTLAGGVQLSVLNSHLYAAWAEGNPFQIRVAVKRSAPILP